MKQPLTHLIFENLFRPFWRREFLFLAIVSSLALAITIQFQDQMEYRNGLGWDGKSYFKLAKEFSSESAFQGTYKPFSYRLAIPFVFGSLANSPDSLREIFQKGNILFSLFVILALWLLLYHKKIPPWPAAIVLSAYTLMWNAPVRMTIFYPFQILPGVLLAATVGLLLLHFYKTSRSPTLFIALILYVCLCVCIRESLIVIAFSSLALAVSIEKQQLQVNCSELRKLLLLPLLSIATLFVLYSTTPFLESDYRFWNSFLYYFYNKSVPIFLLGFLFVYGVFFWLPFLQIKDSWRWLTENLELMLFLVFTLFLSYSGGAAHERILHWMAPVYLSLTALSLGSALKLKSPSRFAFFVLLFVGQILSMRIFSTIPEPKTVESTQTVLMLVPQGLETNFSDLLSWSARKGAVGRVLGLQHFVIALILALLFFLPKLRRVVSSALR